jgi:threonine synthase
VGDERSMVTLSEGGTPLLSCPALAGLIGLRRLYVKDESRNPSGAFKDRPMAVGISKARELGKSSVTTASSGNAAASLATYAAKAGIRSYIFIPENTPAGKVTQALVNGGTLVKVRGSYSNAYALARQASERFGWMNITTTFLNPYAIEGDKTIAYELYRQMDRGVPDWILIPTGAGPLLFGIYKGFQELRRLGLCDRIPRMCAVQAEGCAPIVRAFQAGEDTISAWENPETIASAIADPLKGYEQDGELVLRILRESRGAAVGVTDAGIRDALLELARSEGIYAEPSAAAPIAGLRKMVAEGTIDENSSVVCVVTGHGLKDQAGAVKELEVPLIEPDVNALEGLFP